MAKKNTTSRGARANTPEAIEIIARGVLLRGTRVLLCQNIKHRYYYLPGGHVEPGESAAKAAEREFLEESGLTVRAGRLLLIDEAAFTTKKTAHHEINLVFHVEHTGPKAKSSKPHPRIKSLESHIAFEWVELAAIPETDVRPLAAKAFLAAGAGLTSPTSGPEWVSLF